MTLFCPHPKNLVGLADDLISSPRPRPETKERVVTFPVDNELAVAFALSDGPVVVDLHVEGVGAEGLELAAAVALAVPVVHARPGGL